MDPANPQAQAPLPGLNSTEADYSSFPHGNLSPEFKRQLAALPPAKRREVAEDYIAAASEQWQQYIGLRWRCVERHGSLPSEHQQVALACAHTVHQDELHPAGLLYVPLQMYKDRGFYLCRECLKLMERHKFDFYYELRFTCWYCILEEAERLRQINPHLVVDLRPTK